MRFSPTALRWLRLRQQRLQQAARCDKPTAHFLLSTRQQIQRRKLSIQTVGANSRWTPNSNNKVLWISEKNLFTLIADMLMFVLMRCVHTTQVSWNWLLFFLGILFLCMWTYPGLRNRDSAISRFWGTQFAPSKTPLKWDSVASLIAADKLARCSLS